MSLLFQKGKIGSLKLKHRILMGAMHLGIEGDAHQLNQLKAFYSERAKGGAALIITGGVAVLPAGSGDHMFCLTNQNHREQLKELAQTVHRAGGKIALQLQHNGRYAKSMETGLSPVAPSPIMSRISKETPQELSTTDITTIQDAFIDGTQFAEQAGFDAVELMGSEGYLLNQFLSSLTNQRSDLYGGNFENRMRLPLNIVSGIRQHIGPNYPVIYRISGDDFMEGSTTREQTLLFAQLLVEKGIDALNVGVGWHESRIPTVAASVPPAAFSHIVSAIKHAVDVPVIGSNRIHTPEIAETVLQQEQMDFIAPARPWLADEAFANKLQAGEHTSLNLCVSCNQACLDHTLGHPLKPVGCLVNPKTGHEWDWQNRKKSSTSLTIAIVGGGVAGLATAKAAAEDGHRVTLFEAKEKLGGHFYLASQIPSKNTFKHTIRFYQTALERLNVTIYLSTQPSVEELKNYDKVFLATGVVPSIPQQLKGTRLTHVTNYSDVLSGKVPFGKKIVIIGGGGIGSDLAHFIASSNTVPKSIQGFFESYKTKVEAPAPIELSIISRSPKVAKGVGPTTRWVLLSELRRLGVKLYKGYECLEITETGVWITNEEERQYIEADQVILCTGQTANRELYDLIKEDVPTELVGSSYDATNLNAAQAIRQGYQLVYANEITDI